MLSFDPFEILTFDCYGTLIDWESGIRAALRPVLSAHGVSIADESMLELYAALESQAERGEFVNYKQVLRSVMLGFGRELGFSPTQNEMTCLAESIKDWLPFPDTVESLIALKSRYKLGIISNIDDDLFSSSARHLQVEFEWVITAEQVRSYKPSHNNFKQALARIDAPKERILHVAQSIFHDIVPAQSLGLATVWVNRRQGQSSFGATPPAESQPDLEVPDLKTLVSMIDLG